MSVRIEHQKRKWFGENESFEKEALFSRIDWGKGFVGFEIQSLGQSELEKFLKGESRRFRYVQRNKQSFF